MGNGLDVRRLCGDALPVLPEITDDSEVDIVDIVLRPLQSANILPGSFFYFSQNRGYSRRKSTRRRTRLSSEDHSIDEDHSEPHVLDASDSDAELQEEPKQIIPRRRYAVSGEAFGAVNQRRAAYNPLSWPKTGEQREKLRQALKKSVLLKFLDNDALEALVDAMPVEAKAEHKQIIKQGEWGDSLYVILSGEVDCYDEKSTRPPGPVIVGEERGSFVRTIPNEHGSSFGELAMLWALPRSLSVYAKTSCELGKLTSEVFQNVAQRYAMSEGERRDECLRKVDMLETLGDEALTKIGNALEKRTFEAGEDIVKQGDEGHEFFIVLFGECAATVSTGGCSGLPTDVQEHRRYVAGDLFGERALIHKTKRAATVTAMTRVEVLSLSRRRFERLLGPFDQIDQVLYNTDPRKQISDFYRCGDHLGPRGVTMSDGVRARPSLVPPRVRISQTPCEFKSDWFAVYRPTSRDAIAKMLGGLAVGKGLNVKGKSAKKNRMSGFVPFMQISRNEDKLMIQNSPADARLSIFYSSSDARQLCLGRLQPMLEQTDPAKLDIQDRVIHMLDEFVGLFGIDVPEPCMRQAYITNSDISFLMGWETGRKSEPAFMDMNLHALRGGKPPKVVLYQADKDNPMNPHGLLIAYAEKEVKPVVSDFDTFTVGSRGMKYSRLAEDQAKLAIWSLENTKDILQKKGSMSWTSSWLEVIKEAERSGFHPDLPPYGYGDETSYNLISEVVDAVQETGAVRHGAECFNFFFPQELDTEYLVVWDGFVTDKPWDYKSEEELRTWLLERIAEGYHFPLNPVWPVRDPGWYDVYSALRSSEPAQLALQAWYPPGSGIMEQIEAIHKEFPAGLQIGELEPCPYDDLECCERTDLMYAQIKRSHRKLKVLRDDAFLSAKLALMP